MDRHRAQNLIDRFPAGRILVVGDLMLDQFLVGRVERISPEAPVPVVTFDHDEYRLGGAANVAHNVRALGGQVDIVGVVGPDEAARELTDRLRAIGIGSEGMVTDPSRCTTRKLRIVTTRRQQVARVDYEMDAELPVDLSAELAGRLEQAVGAARVILVSDYLKGTITTSLMARAIECGRTRGIPVLVDPKIPHLDYYAGATLVTPNHYEAEVATSMRIRTTADAQSAARAFRRRVGCESVLITHGEQGMWLLEGSNASGDSPAGRHETHLPAATREVADVTGAGDTVIGTIALGLAAGATLPEAAELANYAAGLVVAKFGPATVTPIELLDAVGQTS